MMSRRVSPVRKKTFFAFGFVGVGVGVWFSRGILSIVVDNVGEFGYRFEFGFGFSCSSSLLPSERV